MTRAHWIARYLRNVLIGFDQLANTVLGGDPDETISSRAAKAHQRGATWGCVLCKILDLFDRSHCEKSVEPDEGGNAT